MGGNHGPSLPGCCDDLFCLHLGIAQTVRDVNGRWIVNGLYLIAGLIALGLLVYLILALLKPEWFG